LHIHALGGLGRYPGDFLGGAYYQFQLFPGLRYLHICRLFLARFEKSHAPFLLQCSMKHLCRMRLFTVMFVLFNGVPAQRHILFHCLLGRLPDE